MLLDKLYQQDAKSFIIFLKMPKFFYHKKS